MSVGDLRETWEYSSRRPESNAKKRETRATSPLLILVIVPVFGREFTTLYCHPHYVVAVRPRQVHMWVRARSQHAVVDLSARAAGPYPPRIHSPSLRRMRPHDPHDAGHSGLSSVNHLFLWYWVTLDHHFFRTKRYSKFG